MLLLYVSGDTGKYYCGMKLLSCNCCDGHCGPNNGCNCGPCAQLDREEEERKVEMAHKPKPSGPVIDSWTWGQQPGMSGDSVTLTQTLGASDRLLDMGSTARYVRVSHKTNPWDR